MKLLLDECVSRYVKPDFVGHEVHTVEEAGVKGLKNGELLRAASGKYDVLVTVDKGMAHQQNLAGLQIAILILEARSNAYESLVALIPDALAALQSVQPGAIVRIGPRR
jgi:predicted nuclease of predicted toxin-antitoxin system